uniref:8.9 kDa family member n=1 Tax=Rhipicephalus zambeziensis TaxID=60191 RepID=A0A224YBF0_9ACAR
MTLRSCTWILQRSFEVRTRRRTYAVSYRNRCKLGMQTMLMALVLLLVFQRSLSKIPSLRFEKFRCDYDNYSLSMGGYLRLANPCVRLVCRYYHRELTVNGCPAPPNSSDPDDPQYAMYWPYCCNSSAT